MQAAGGSRLHPIRRSRAAQFDRASEELGSAAQLHARRGDTPTGGRVPFPGASNMSLGEGGRHTCGPVAQANPARIIGLGPYKIRGCDGTEDMKTPAGDWHASRTCAASARHARVKPRLLPEQLVVLARMIHAIDPYARRNSRNAGAGVRVQ